MFEFNKDSLLNKVKKFYFKNRRLPTYREMSKLFKLSSTSTISYNVNKWIEAGVFNLEGKSLVPTEKFFAIPLLGSIKAGVPDEAVEFFDSHSFQEPTFSDPGSSYALKISGDSMIDEGIKDGDTVILDKNKEPKPGDVVAAYIDEEWTLKYFMKKGKKIYLQAANKRYKDIYPKRNLELGGVVTSVVRSY